MNPSQMINMNPQMAQQQVMLQQAQQQQVPGPGMMNPGMVHVQVPPQNIVQGQPPQDQHHHHHQQHQQQQQQHQQHQQQQEQKLDNISKVKNYYWQMKEALMDTMGSASTNVNMNSQIDEGSRNAGEGHHAKFEESLEKFYAFCDQLELNLITALDCQLQGKSSQQYTPTSIVSTPVDSQKYSHYLSTVRNQVVYAKDIHSALVDAGTSISNLNAVTAMESSN